MGHTDRAGNLAGRRRDLDEHHEGNRIDADMSQPQPTREATRDRQVGDDRPAERDRREG